jgi:hypothetical protein
VVRKYLEQRKKEKIAHTLSIEVQKLEDLPNESWLKGKKQFWKNKKKQGTIFPPLKTVIKTLPCQQYSRCVTFFLSFILLTTTM